MTEWYTSTRKSNGSPTKALMARSSAGVHVATTGTNVLLAPKVALTPPVTLATVASASVRLFASSSRRSRTDK